MKIPVLIPNIFNHPFTYDDNGLNLKKGDYVEIPFGKKSKIGVVWDEFEKNINKDFSIKKITAECNFEKRLITIERDTGKKKFDELMRLKNAEVKRLQEVIKKSQKPDYTKLWFVGGFVAGVGLSIGIFYAAAQASK